VRIARLLRRSPVAAETIVTYVRARRRMARDDDVRRLLAFARRNVGNQTDRASLAEARQLARTASLTLGLLPDDPRCLVRSLVLVELLARRGIAATLVIGTSAVADFRAHAWVELSGEPLLSSAGFGEGRLAEL
jgi:Transglutaminase-like superfamily